MIPLINGMSTDTEAIAFLRHVREFARADVGLAADLADSLARSGDRISPEGGIAADVASTGGPSSLSTLLCPLFLRTAGLIVPKLGVPGRPAGGIDCLAQIDGYKTVLNELDLQHVLGHSGYAHFLANERYAPMDARLFRLRQRHDAQQVPTLVVASLLSKKLAVGVRRAGLDVRVAPHGNFGSTWGDARSNARIFIEAASRHGIEAFPVLTDGRFPYQPYVGRREALLGLACIFDGTAPPWLHDHFMLCQALALAAVPPGIRASVLEASVADLKEHFLANVEAQGGTAAGFEQLVDQTRAAHDRHEVVAEEGGFVTYSLEGIRRTLVHYQEAAERDHSGFSDPVGLVLLRRPGEWAPKGAAVATLRVEDEGLRAEIARSLRPFVARMSDVPSSPMCEGVSVDESE